MISIVDNTYYKEGEVQLMLPIGANCTFIGPNGIKFHSIFGKILINDYIRHPKRKLFPFQETPMHKDDKGTFVNQLFQLDRQYLAVYSDNGQHLFRTDTFFQVDGTVYDDVNVNLEFKTEKEQEMSLSELKEKFQRILSNNKFLCVVDDDGELHEYRKNTLDFEIPLSGIMVYGDGIKLKAFDYKMQLCDEQISIKSHELNIQQIEQPNLENCSSIPEPIIHKM